MNKTVNYMVLDTETATLPFVNSMNLSAEQKKKVAIAKPLVYDIGWTIANRTHGIIEKKNYLVAETFSVPAVFDTAYYHNKRPIYLKMLADGEIEIKTWNEIADILIADMDKCQYVCAYNAMFDYKKAIPFTESYIKALYSPSYYNWENLQKNLCGEIANGATPASNKQFDNKIFKFRGNEYTMIDVWGLSCNTLLNNNNFRRKCLENSSITASGTYFSTSAETAYQYMIEHYDFIEDHTALSDAEIETALLLKCLKRGKKIEGIVCFPFRMLGYTADFVINDTKCTKEMVLHVLEKMQLYVDTHNSNYAHSVQNSIDHIARVWGM